MPLLSTRMHCHCADRPLGANIVPTVLILVISIAVLLGALAGYFFASRPRGANASLAPSRTESAVWPQVATAAVATDADDRVGREKARIIRSLEAEAWSLRDKLADRDPASIELEALRRQHRELAPALDDALREAARYRQLVVDIENNAPPPILLGAAEPDDLKLIVGIGPVLERMLHNLGVGTFRQIARWTDSDVAEFDAKLPEFPGRIVRDQWVTQARALHESKYGERP